MSYTIKISASPRLLYQAKTYPLTRVPVAKRAEVKKNIEKAGVLESALIYGEVKTKIVSSDKFKGSVVEAEAKIINPKWYRRLRTRPVVVSFVQARKRRKR